MYWSQSCINTRLSKYPISPIFGTKQGNIFPHHIPNLQPIPIKFLKVIGKNLKCFSNYVLIKFNEFHKALEVHMSSLWRALFFKTREIHYSGKLKSNA